MLDKEAVQEREEKIRLLVRELPDRDRLAFFKESEKQLKDPDTYAVLNYIFIAGLHHFYLGKWRHGLVNIAIFWTGVALCFTVYPYTLAGLIVIIAITVFEFYELFQSQVIVQDYNNNVMRSVYDKVLAHKS